jgi:CHAT domain-containing protein
VPGNLLLTMWNVEDKTKRDLMLAFYADYLKSGDAVGAMIRAQRCLLADSRRAGPRLPAAGPPFPIGFQGSDMPGK